MAQIEIKKGHDIRMVGVPSLDLVRAPRPQTVAIKPIEFRGCKPKLLVNTGDTVKIGTPLFHNKRQPSVQWVSPAAGTVKYIQIGPRRTVERIIISVASREDSVAHPAIKAAEIKTLGRDKIKETLLAGGVWPMIRQRPYNKVANPEETPRDIFISGWNTAPCSVDLELALEGKQAAFQAGLDALSVLTDGQIHLSIKETTKSEVFLKAQGVKLHTFSGPHPAGNVGIQIHHIQPIKPRDVVWVVQAQQVVTIGQFLLTGVFDPAIVATVGGPGVKNPVHLQTRMGVNLGAVLEDRLQPGDQRIISGDVLTGKKTSLEGYLGFYDTTISVIPEGGKREFMGMLRPGSSRTRYSLMRAFFGAKKNPYPFNTLQNGSERAMIPLNAWEDVLPMDILPNALFRSILAKDIEEMEQLGIYECDEEDFALCSFACPSKIDVGAVIRQGLELMEQES